MPQSNLWLMVCFSPKGGQNSLNLSQVQWCALTSTVLAAQQVELEGLEIRWGTEWDYYVKRTTKQQKNMKNSLNICKSVSQVVWIDVTILKGEFIMLKNVAQDLPFYKSYSVYQIELLILCLSLRISNLGKY